MKRLLLVGLFSINVSAAEEVDLTKDAMYYCTDTAVAEISKGKSKKIKPDKFSLKVKSGVMTMSEDGNEPIIWKQKDTTLYYAYMSGATEMNVFTMINVGAKGFLTFTLYKNWSVGEVYSLDNNIMQISQGSCTKW